MIFVGIDVASTKHDCFVMNDQGEVLYDVFTISNDVKGLKKLHKILNDVESIDSNVRIGLESTGLYHLNLVNFLSSQDFKVQVINPLLTSMARKATSVRKTKNDTIDAKAICKFLEGNKHDFKPYTPTVYNNEVLKSLSRKRLNLTKQLTKHKLELYVLVSKTFPEFLDVFSVFHIKSSYEILHKYSIPSVIAKTRVDAIANTLSKASKGRLKMDKAIKLKELAQSTIGDKSEYFAFQIKMTIEIIRYIEMHISSIDSEIETIIDEHFSNLLTVPGVSYNTAALLIGEIGNIDRFSSFDKLLAYFGLDPIVYQSGKYNAENTKASKRGSSYARYSLFHISKCIVQHDPTFKNYYNKKLSEGKHYFTILVHVSKKVLRVIYTLLKYNLTFVPQS